MILTRERTPNFVYVSLILCVWFCELEPLNLCNVIWLRIVCDALCPDTHKHTHTYRMISSRWVFMQQEKEPPHHWGGKTIAVELNRSRNRLRGLLVWWCENIQWHRDDNDDDETDTQRVCAFDR